MRSNKEQVIKFFGVKLCGQRVIVGPSGSFGWGGGFDFDFAGLDVVWVVDNEIAGRVTYTSPAFPPLGCCIGLECALAHSASKLVG